MNMPPDSEGPLDAIDAVIEEIQKSRLEQAEALLRECERALFIGEWLPNTTTENLAERVRTFNRRSHPTVVGKS